MPFMPVNDLQLVLLAIAAALLLALFAWSKWQERQALKQFEQSLHEGVSDALLGEAEPVAKRSLQEPGFGQAPASPFRGGRQEPTLTQAPVRPLEATDEPLAAKTAVTETLGRDQPDEPDAEPSSPTQSHWVEDSLLDSVIELRCAHPVDGVGVFDAMATLSQAQLPLPVNVVVWEGRAESWVPPDRFGFYSELLVAIQLAHRTATLSDVDMARFVSAVEQMAVRLDADFDVPDVSALAEQAKQLGQTCARFDVQLGLTLESTVGPWDGARLSQVMMAHGLVRAQGQAVRWLCLDANGHICFNLAPASLLVDRLALEMDVPLVAMSEHPLKRMFDIAQQLATSLQARVVDDHGQIIGEHSFAAIDGQLQLLLEQMRAAGIEPGSARAFRLYGALGE